MELTRASLIVGVTVGIASAGMSLSVRATPPQPEWRWCRNEIRHAAMRSDYATAAQLAHDMYLRCRTSLGDSHPDTTHAAAAVREYRSLHNCDEQTKQHYATSLASRVAAWRKIVSQAKDVLPALQETSALLKCFHSCLQSIPPAMPPEVLIRAECNWGIARILALARMPVAAKSYAISAREKSLSVEGVDLLTKSNDFMLAEILREAGVDLQERLALLNGIVDFTEQCQVTGQLAWWKERAMTLLAENYYLQGDHQQADRLYAEVRSLLPEDSDHDIVGWCKSWCDRHEARRLMEKGDWDGAYSKILLARVGTIDYGHRNLSKGLTMERILRMSADIQRKRGNHKEADEDLEYADLIARHAEKLRTALEAELKNFREPDPNPTPQG